MVRRLVAAVVISGALVGLVVTPASGFTKKKGCKLISEADIEEIFGAAPTQTTPGDKKGKYTTCTWKLPTDAGDATVFIGLDKPNKLNKSDFKKKSKGDVEKVKGIKKGFLDGITVTFIKNDNFVNVQYLGPNPEATNTDGLIELAKELYGKL